jgi:heme exporter protein D
VNLGPGAVFVWSSYAAVAIVLGCLLVWLLIDGMKQQRKLDQLEARGVRRRSAQAGPATSTPEGQDTA